MVGATYRVSFLAHFFRLSESNTSVRTELVAGVTTFLTMAYIIFVQPAVLSGAMFEAPTGMDFGAVTTATCLAAALATTAMALGARYPIALAPGMGQNFFFVFTAIPAAAAVGAPEPWAAALGAVFVAGVVFLVISLVGLREKLMDAVSPNLKHGIAVGIGLFIAFIGLRNAQLVLVNPGTAVSMNPHLGSPDVIVFLVGFVVATVLHARKVRGSIVLGVASSLALTLLLRSLLPFLPDAVSNSEVVTGSLLVTQFAPAHGVVALPPSMGPTFLQMDVATAVSAAMIPIVIILGSSSPRHCMRGRLGGQSCWEL